MTKISCHILISYMHLVVGLRYKKKLLPVAISALYITGYMIMAFIVNESISPLWMTFIVIALGIVGVHGFIAANFN